MKLSSSLLELLIMSVRVVSLVIVKDFVAESYKTPPTDNEGYKRLVETTKSALLKRLNLNDFMIKMSFKTKRILLLTIQVKPMRSARRWPSRNVVADKAVNSACLYVDIGQATKAFRILRSCM